MTARTMAARTWISVLIVSMLGVAPHPADADPCPAGYEFTADAFTPWLDFGSEGVLHGIRTSSETTVTLQVQSCTNSSRPCGSCTLVGPIRNRDAEAGTVQNQRCTNNPATPCTSDADCLEQCLGGSDDGESCASGCPGQSSPTVIPAGTCVGAGTCQFYFGSPMTTTTGAGWNMCLVTQVRGNVTGTVDPATGAFDTTWPLRQTIYSGSSTYQCPACDETATTGDANVNDGVRGGTCTDGPRKGCECDASGRFAYPQNGKPFTSLDCPPIPPVFGSTDVTVPLKTSTMSVELTSSHRNCRDSGFPSTKCFCQTCPTAAHEPCSTNADCGGLTCGGRRCISGSNYGAVCTVNGSNTTECGTFGFCAIPGFVTRPHPCVSYEGTPVCTEQVDGSGICEEGPVSQSCLAEPWRGCVSNNDCTAPDVCVAHARSCYLDNGVLGSSGAVSAVGSTEPPVDDVASVELAGLYCAGYGTYPIYDAAGLPGLARISMPGTLRGLPPTSTVTATPTVTVTPTPTATATATQTSTPTPTPPPDPALIAPPLNPSIVSDTGASTEFIYTGANPIQTGVTAGTIERKRAALVRGRILDKDGNGLPLVTIDVLGHPEFGQTYTRADGRFDFVVNGGGKLTVRADKALHLQVQRQIDVAWQGSSELTDIVMIQRDAAVTPITIPFAGTQFQAAQSLLPSTDGSGTRIGTVLFPPSTTATVNGVPTSTINVHITEYTVGDNGPKRMPGPLPPNIAYTYAVELGATEAPGPTDRVVFTDPYPVFYVDNFLDFEVGETVPSGFYDRATGTWVPSESGQVIKILTVPPAAVTIDSDGDNVADNTLNISPEERAKLVELYPTAGKTLWRVKIPHFTPWDHNWPFGPPPDFTPPDPPKDPPGGPKPPKDPPDPPREPKNPPDGPPKPDGKKKCSSIIGCQDQTLGQEIDVAGTLYTLTYQSDRTPGDLTARTVEVPISAPPASLLRVETELLIGGRRIVAPVVTPPFPPSYVVTWDGLDAYGRALQGAQVARVRVGYTYNGSYERVGRLGVGRFGGPGNGVKLDASFRETTITAWYEEDRVLGGWDARGIGLGGWSVDVHHAYNPASRIIYYGNGDERTSSSIGGVIERVAGSTTAGAGFAGDGGSALVARFNDPEGIVAGPDGGLFIADSLNNRIRRIDPNGIVRTVAGTGELAYLDGAPLSAKLGRPTGLAMGAGGELYIADESNRRVRKLHPGTCVIESWRRCYIDADCTAGGDSCSGAAVTTYAGSTNTPTANCPVNAAAGLCGDGGMAVNAELRRPSELAVGADGVVYIADFELRRVRRVGTDGRIENFAGSGASGSDGNGGPATSARFSSPRSIGLAPDGSLYIGDWNNSDIRRVGLDGIITLIAGQGGFGEDGDGGTALASELTRPRYFSFAPDGTVYFSHGRTTITPIRCRIRMITPDGIISTAAGTGPCGSTGDGSYATSPTVTLSDPQGTAIGPDGSLYMSVGSRIRRVTPVLPGFGATNATVPSLGGTAVYVFDPNGRHLETRDVLTGALESQFSYDAAGRLSGITDRNGNVTTIARDGSGTVTITAPPGGLNGLRTTLSAPTAVGYLTTVADPANDTSLATFAATGLMSAFRTPRLHTSHYTFTTLGRLETAKDASGQLPNPNPAKLLALTTRASGHTVTYTSAGGHVTSYAADNTASGGVIFADTAPSGLTTTTTTDTGGLRTTTFPSGRVETYTATPDFRFGLQAPVYSRVITTPGGKTYTRQVSRPTPAGWTGIDKVGVSGFTESVIVNGRTPAETRVYDVVSGTRTLTVTSSEGRARRWTFDARGRVTLDEAAYGSGSLLSIASTYSTATNLLSTITEGARHVQFLYDPQYRLEYVIDPLTRTYQMGYDASDRLTSVVSPGGRTVSFTYDADGNVQTIRPPSSGLPPVHTFDYTDVGLLSQYIPPAVPGTGGISYAYTVDRQLDLVTPPAGVPGIDLTYDALTGRLSALIFPAGQYSYSYHSSGSGSGELAQVTSSVPDAVGMSFAYDADLLTSTQWNGIVPGTPPSLEWRYDNDLRIDQRTIRGVDAVTYQYDKDDLLTVAGAATIERNGPEGLVSKVTVGNIEEIRQYNAFGEIAAIVVTDGSTPIVSWTYDSVSAPRDALGRVVQITEQVGINPPTSTTYGYSPAGHLEDVSHDGVPIAPHPAYAFDLNGNRIAAPGVTVTDYDKQDRLLEYDSVAYAYDAVGQLANKTAPGNVTTEYVHDALGNLRSVSLPSGTTVDYIVDTNDSRVGRRVDGTLTNVWVYEAETEIAAEFDGDGQLVAQFVYGSSTVPDYMIRSGTIYRLVADASGSVRLVVNVSDGSIAQELQYDEWGRVMVDTNPGFQPFGFAGGLYDPDTGLVRFGARNYDATVGRWISKDRSEFLGGDTNLYAYAFNDPVNFVDLNGHRAQPKILGGGGGAGSIGIGIGVGAAAVAPGTREAVRETVDNARKQFAGRKGERSLGKGRGDDPYYGKDVDELRKIRDDRTGEYSDSEKARAKRIEKEKRKQDRDRNRKKRKGPKDGPCDTN